MGRFDGVLLASDFDNTLIYTEDALLRGEPIPPLPERNRQALTYFMAEGGRFAISTGRALAAFEKYAPLVPMNAPGVICNGAALYDFAKQEYLVSALLDENARQRGQLVLDRFPVDQNQARVTTAAYQAERDLDRLMYQDTGLYRNQQYAKASTVLLQTMYEEIPILWDQELKYRPSFSAAGDTVTLPVICQKICGVKDGNASQYWLDIKKLITPDTEVVRSVPWVQGTDPNPVKPYATQFLKNGKLLRSKIKAHSAYLYGILRAEVQEHLLDKLQLLLDQKLIRGTFENGTEYTVIATALNLPKDLLRKIQKFDFTKKNPKLIYINTTEKMISLEDSILTAFLSLVGFDVLFFVPTGYQCIEQHFARPFAGETQIGDYLYDLRIPDFNTVQESGLHSIRKLFGRSS